MPTANGTGTLAMSPADLAAHLGTLGGPSDVDKFLRQARMLAAVSAPDDADVLKPVGRSAADLVRDVAPEPDWLVPGMLARSWTIKMAAREKIGKGTLIAYLLGCMERGEPTVFGEACEPTTALVFTEEPEDSMREKIAQAGLQRAWIVFGWELASCDTWDAKVARLVALAGEQGHGVIFVDNISRATAAEDEAGVELARAVETLSDAAKAAGLATIIDHHHKKGAGRLEDKSRGGTALAGAMENNVEMERVGDWDSRVRRLSSRGRVSSTVWTRTIALSEDGRTYEIVADDTQPQTAKERQRLRLLHGAGDAGVTAAEFATLAEFSDDTARRTLGEFVGKGWAALDDSGWPHRWRSTGEGLDGPLDLLDAPGPWEDR